MVILVFLYIFMIIILLFILLIFSKIQIKIEDFKFSSQLPKHTNKDYKIIFKLYILSKIPIFKLVITDEKIKKMNMKEKFRKMETKIIEKKEFLNKNIIESIKKVELMIKNIELKIDLGTESTILTSILVPVISTVISIFINQKIQDYNRQKFIVNPIFNNKNLINIEITSIFELKMIHIIDSIYVLNKKEGVENYERTSNRRTYDNCYE